MSEKASCAFETKNFSGDKKIIIPDQNPNSMKPDMINATMVNAHYYYPAYGQEG